MRRERDRAVEEYSAQTGLIDETPDQNLAPEVLELRFRYFDGTQWVLQWDSEERQGLPMAVEITLVLAPINYDQLSREELDEVYASGLPTYRLIVRLPAAEPTTSEQTEESSSESAEASSPSAGSSGSSSGSSSGGTSGSGGSGGGGSGGGTSGGGTSGGGGFGSGAGGSGNNSGGGTGNNNQRQGGNR
jgi:hypothetical protein